MIVIAGINGSGKTTLLEEINNQYLKDVLYLSASDENNLFEVTIPILQLKNSYADAPKGREISAPHAAKRNVGLRERAIQWSSERTTEYYMLRFVSFFQNFPDGVIRKPHIPLRCMWD
ncbi:hypothetical protein Barb4_01681 [Bacteroidales bacterium Barb4]|nr:hypothetical protein Barb4_01681 [Bacteroidales bacterium Barb4]